MPLGRQLHVIRQWLPLIIASVLACAIAAGVIASQLSSTYISDVRLFSGPTLDGTIDNGDLVAGAQLAATYAELATTRAVLQGAITATGVNMSVDELLSAVSTHVPVNSGLLTISVSAGSPALAADLANAIATQLVNYPAEPGQPKPNSNVTLTVIDPAVPPIQPVGPRVVFSIALGAVIGLVLSVSVAFLIENIRHPELGEEVAVQT